MQVLVTGGGGYIGTVLVARLLKKGYKVHVLDRFFFGKDKLDSVYKNRNLKLIQDDVRYFDERILDGIDVVIDMAALSNDPAGELDPRKTLDINFRGRARVARLSKKHNVDRYILASSCSIYGFRNGYLDETSKINPLTAYARANRKAEIAAQKLADDRFTTTILRFATVFGLSARMRFDLAINNMALNLFKNNPIPIMRDGQQWRPFIHIKDVAEAYVTVMNADKKKINGEIFNVGTNAQNYQVLPLAKEISQAIGVPLRKNWYGDPDVRSYQISFAKIHDVLNYTTRYNVAYGAREIFSALRRKKTAETLQTKTVDWYRYLIDAQKTVSDVTIDGKIL